MAKPTRSHLTHILVSLGAPDTLLPFFSNNSSDKNPSKKGHQKNPLKKRLPSNKSLGKKVISEAKTIDRSQIAIAIFVQQSNGVCQTVYYMSNIADNRRQVLIMVRFAHPLLKSLFLWRNIMRFHPYVLQLLNECQEFIRILSVKLFKIQRGYQERIEVHFVFLEKQSFRK